jgi:flavin-dependent dehydrogenase
LISRRERFDPLKSLLMAKSSSVQPDVLVLGQHPSAYLAALLLRTGKHAAEVTQLCIPSEPWPDRLVLINPSFFALHPELTKLKKKLSLTAVWGVQFVSDKPDMRSEHRAKTSMGCICIYSELRKAMAELAKEAGAKLLTPSKMHVESVDHSGMVVHADGKPIRARAMLLAGTLGREDARRLALPEPWGAEDVRRYSFVRLREVASGADSAKPLLPMSLDLGGALTWAWMLPGKGEVQLTVEQPIRGAKTPKQLLQLWAVVLRAHGLIVSEQIIEDKQIFSMDVPAAGALNREPIGNRTLLIGPAGGFFTACLEDIYPNCWSSVFAVDTIRKALKEPHLQDALSPYREEWGTTLGEYLRGPQQNLRFLLPLVYRNAVMTSRLAESILLGKSVVR